MISADIETPAKRLLQFANGLTAQWPLPGGIIALATPDGRITQLPFGAADIEKNTPVSGQHLFLIGSISKTFIALLVTLLAQEQLLSLDEPVVAYLPWLSLPAGPTVTLRHLLRHTAGLIKGADALPDEMAQAWGVRETVRNTPPDAFFHYSNIGYIILGRVIRAVTGQDAAALCRTRLLTPLGLANTLVGVTNGTRKLFAKGYMPERDDRPWAPGDQLAPAPWLEVNGADGNIAMTASDLARFAQLLTGDGIVDDRQIIPSAVLAEMRQSVAPGGEDVVSLLDGGGVESSQYGLGVNVETILGSSCLTHGGGMVGYSSFLLADRDQKLAVAVLTNAPGECPVAQIIARVGHALLKAPEKAQAMMDLVSLEAGLANTLSQPMAFAAVCPAAGHSAPLRFTLEAEGQRTTLRAEGMTARLYRSWDGRYVTDHPAMRDFHLSPSENGWVYGGTIYRPNIAHFVEPAPPAPHPCIGQYRCYSPWFCRFRIVMRGEDLFLVAPGGVEAPAEDMLLVPLAPGLFRIGADPRLPERLIMGPVIDGQVITINRDGCVYSRAFMD